MKLSIVIPVYKIENEIRNCLESCLNQNFEDYEIICVDDGSPDRSGEICDEYAAKYPLIKVIHKENGGVSSARNTGIEAARGEWIWFVDGDDWIECNIIPHMMSAVSGDYLKFNVKTVYEKTEANPSKEYHSKEMGVAQSIEHGCLCFQQWFKRETLISKNLRFNCNMKYTEDVLFVVKYMSFSNSGVFFDYDVYNYYQRENSAIHNIDKSHYIFCLKCALMEFNECAKSTANDPAVYEYMRDTYIRMFLWNLMTNEPSYKKIKEELTELTSIGVYPYSKRKEYILNGRNNKEKIIRAFYKIMRHKALFLICARIKAKNAK